MKFAMSYSCGKDSTLALHEMLEQGHEPVCLIVMVNEQAGRSYFHGADREMLRLYGEALELPVISCPADGADALLPAVAARTGGKRTRRAKCGEAVSKKRP